MFGSNYGLRNLLWSHWHLPRLMWWILPRRVISLAHLRWKSFQLNPPINGGPHSCNTIAFEHSMHRSSIAFDEHRHAIVSNQWSSKWLNEWGLTSSGHNEAIANRNRPMHEWVCAVVCGSVRPWRLVRPDIAAYVSHMTGGPVMVSCPGIQFKGNNMTLWGILYMCISFYKQSTT